MYFQSKKFDILIYVDVPMFKDGYNTVSTGNVFICKSAIEPKYFKYVVDLREPFFMKSVNTISLQELGSDAAEKHEFQHKDLDIAKILQAKRNDPLNRHRLQSLSNISPAVRSYWLQWNSLQIHDSVLYRKFQNEKANIEPNVQLIVPFELEFK